MQRQRKHLPTVGQRVLPGLGSERRLEHAALTVGAHRLPTNTTTRAHSIHRWFNFIAGFSPEFVMQCCADARLNAEDHLLDPFAGCATAPLVACELGMKATGYEAHPVFARIGRAKLPAAGARNEVLEINEVILDGLQKPVNVDTLPAAPKEFLSKLFGFETLPTLLGAKRALQERGLTDSDTAFMIMSRIVDKSSHSQTDGIYKAPTSRKTAQRPSDVCAETVRMVLGDLAALTEPDYAARATIVPHSSERMSEVENDSASIVVTSPPYLNNFDYAEMTRMLLYFWGMADSWGEITDRVRRNLIVNTTTALKGHKDRQQEYRDRIPSPLKAHLDGLVVALRQKRAVRAGKKEYDYLIYPYFAQMVSVLNECLRCLRPRGRTNIMIADAALYGVHISTPQILAEIMSAIGFQHVECKHIRNRGHRWELAKREGSAKGLGEYHIVAVK